MQIDLNADLGESFGVWRLGDDEAMLDVVTSANVACGFHAGDPALLLRTCRAAAARGVRIGAQVSYRDLAGFGRRFIDVTPEDLSADVIYQIGALQALAHAAGSVVSYVKPHGALYNTIVSNHGQARAVAEAVHAVDPNLPVLGLSGSVFFTEAQDLGLRTVPEAFADRAYRPDGQLVSRRERNAVLHDVDEIADRVASMVNAGRVHAVDGSTIPITVESVCVHGDSPGAVQIASTVRKRLLAYGVRTGAVRLMRPKPGRPDLRDYAGYFDVPAATPDSALTITWAGVTTLLIDDGTSALLTDGFFSRPNLAAVGLRRISPSLPRIDGCLARIGVDRLDAVLPVHTHFDHAMDSAVVAERTGAVLVGGTSAAQVGVGHGLPDARLVVATPGDAITLGAYDVTLVASEHCPPDRFPGEITEPVVPPVKASAYRCGEAWSTLVHHRASDRRLLIVGSAGFVRGALAGRRAEIVYLGVGQLGLQPEQYLVDYWTETVRAVGARRVVLIHWDDFFRPLHKPLRALPYAGDDLDVSMRVLSRLAEEDGIPLHLPTLWQAADPWA